MRLHKETELTAAPGGAVWKINVKFYWNGTLSNQVNYEKKRDVTFLVKIISSQRKVKFELQKCAPSSRRD